MVILRRFSKLITTLDNPDDELDAAVPKSTAVFTLMSVREWLLSEPINHEVNFGRIGCNSLIANDCLTYLLSLFHTGFTSFTLQAPLLHYAALQWSHHARIAEKFCDDTLPLTKKLLTIASPDVESPWNSLINEFSKYIIHDIFGGSVTPGDSAMYHASQFGLVRSVQLLIEEGVSVDECAPTGESSLHVAAAAGYDDVVQLLISHGAQVNFKGFSILGKPCSQNHVEVVRILIEHGADVNGRKEYKSSPLAAAASIGALKIMHMLLKAGAYVNDIEYSGNPLASAAFFGQAEAVRVLLDNGADPNIHGSLNWGSLHTAAIGRHEDVLRTLLLYGLADINATALQAAALESHCAIIRIF